MKRNRDKKNELPRRGFKPWIFKQVPAHNLNFEGDFSTLQKNHDEKLQTKI